MKRTELLQRVLNGEMIVGVEYRGAEAVRYAANADAKRAESAAIKHRIELKGGKQQEVTQYFDKEELQKLGDLAKWAAEFNNKPLPFKKGSTVLWFIESFAWTQRGQRATGHLVALED